MKKLKLKYGCNPNQQNAEVYMDEGRELPFELLNGKKVKINSVDVSEVMEITVRVEDRFNVYLGSSAHIDLKISHLAGMLKEVDADTIGSIDLSEYTPENGRGILTRE